MVTRQGGDLLLASLCSVKSADIRTTFHDGAAADLRNGRPGGRDQKSLRIKLGNRLGDVRRCRRGGPHRGYGWAPRKNEYEICLNFFDQGVSP
jgi:hypothetical protein